MATLTCAMLSGCGGTVARQIGTPENPTPPTPPPATGFAGVGFSGIVHAGLAALAGASVQVYAAGTSGNGSGAVALFASSLVTDAAGAFTVPAAYTCPAAASQLYLMARGGTIAGAAASGGNAAVALMAVVGQCNQVASASSFVVNEVTTASAAWSLSQFLSPGGSIGARSTNLVGLANAFATATNLAGSASGSASGGASLLGGRSSAGKINAVANLLHACTSSGASSSSSCSTLSQLTTIGGTVPANTLDAALSLVRHPGSNVAALYGLAAAKPVFSPALTAAPADWTLVVQYAGGGMVDPTGLGIDSKGNVWVASFSGVISKFTPIGTPVFPSGITGSGLNASYGLAVDASDNVWVPNRDAPVSSAGVGNVSVFNSGGQPVSGGNGYVSGGLNYPIAVAIDPSATAWVVDYGNSHLTLLSPTGSPLSGASGYTTGLFSFPVAVAIDASHNGWIANQGSDAVGNGNVTRISADGRQLTNFNCCNGASGLAIDGTGNVWVANYYSSSVSQISSAGVVLSKGSFTGGGLSYPQGIAIDGAGTVWVANYRGPSITELAGVSSASPGQPISPSAGWAPDAALSLSYALAIDASGNIWVTNFGTGTLTQFVGMAAPVKTPLIGPVENP